MKAYLISSTEYPANTPDKFIMDENGNYYGVMNHSCAIFHNYPNNITFWETAECADSDRFFNIATADISKEQLDEFDSLTKEYLRIDAETPEFTEQYPDGMSSQWKSKKEYNDACKEWMRRHEIWVIESNIASYITKKRVLLKERENLFNSFI